MPLRVFELAKELNTPTKELIKRIEKLGIKISGNFAALTKDQIAEIKNDFKSPGSIKDKVDPAAAIGAPKVKRRIISAKMATETQKPKKTTKTKKADADEVEDLAAKDKKTAKKPKKTIRKKAAKKADGEAVKITAVEADEAQKEAKKKTKKAAKKKTEEAEVATEAASPKTAKSAAAIIKIKDAGEKPENEATDTKTKKTKKTIKRDSAGIIQLKDGKEETKKKTSVRKAKKKDEAVPETAEEVKKPGEEVSKKAKADKEEKEVAEVKAKKPRTEPLNKIDPGKVRIVRRREEEAPEAEEIEETTTVRKLTGPDVAELEKETDEDLKLKDEKKTAKAPGKKDKFRVGRSLSTDEVDDFYSEDADFEKKRRVAAKKRASKAARRKERAKKQKAAATKKVKHTFNPRQKDLTVGENITVGDLASLIGIKAAEIIRTLISLGVMATITQSIDGETAALVAAEHDVEIKVAIQSIEDEIESIEDDVDNLIARSPVVTIMGHVDHGKTSLLDQIRSTNVTDGEAGGITQHIGAYHVKTKEGKITFLDTPGHEAFTAMRARGADVTDIVILVVAADDGPRPQTVEAIDHSKAANVEIIVAINKCDKPDADPDKTIRQLMEYGLVSEEYGGDIPMIQVSAKTGDGIPKLLEMIQLQAEIMELKADPYRSAQGVVIESRVDTGKGNTATILVQTGTLSIGDCFVAGTEYGRIRAMWDDKGKALVKGYPSIPVEIVGLNGTPRAGDSFNVGSDEKQVRQIATLRAQREKEQAQSQQQKRTLENLVESIGKEEKRELNLILKTDVIGSLEALSDALLRLGNEEVSINIKRGAVGGITSDDVLLATTSEAIIIGFNTRPNPEAKKRAQDENVEIRHYGVIYEIIDDVTKALEGMLEPVVREEIQGKAEILEIFNIPKIGTVAGSRVVEGKFLSTSPVRVIRDNIIIFDGRLASLRRFKEDAKEVSAPMECGISIESFRDLRAGDELESYMRFETAAKFDG